MFRMRPHAAYYRKNPSQQLHAQVWHVVAYEDDTQVMGSTILMFRITSLLHLFLQCMDFT
jgi:hypothetical protein